MVKIKIRTLLSSYIGLETPTQKRKRYIYWTTTIHCKGNIYRKPRMHTYNPPFLNPLGTTAEQLKAWLREATREKRKRKETLGKL